MIREDQYAGALMTIKSLQAEVERLRNQINNLLKPMRDQAIARAEATEADTARLDWLDKTFSGVERFVRNDEWVVQRYQQVCGCIGYGKTVRAAIDAARAAK